MGALALFTQPLHAYVTMLYHTAYEEVHERSLDKISGEP